MVNPLFPLTNNEKITNGIFKCIFFNWSFPFLIQISLHLVSKREFIWQVHIGWGYGLVSGDMMASSNGNSFRVTGHLCGEFTGPRWILRTKDSDTELWCFICVWINGWVNNHEAGDLRRYRAHYDVTAMNRRQGNTWADAYPVYWRIYASLRDNLLIRFNRTHIWQVPP